MIILRSLENITPVPNQKAKDFEESFDLNDPYNFFFERFFSGFLDFNPQHEIDSIKDKIGTHFFSK